MAFLKEIEQNKTVLRKTSGKWRESKLEEMIVKDEEDYYRLIKETYFEKYYEQIEDFTFKSVIIPLTLEDIKTIYDANMEFETSKKTELDMTNIAQKIDEGIDKIRKQTNSDCEVFVRLSSRSPRDAIYHLEEFPGLFAKLHAFFKACTGGARIPISILPTTMLSLYKESFIKLLVGTFISFLFDVPYIIIIKMNFE